MRRSYPAAVGDTSNAGSDKVFVEKKRQVQSGLMRGIEKEGRADCAYRPSPHAGQARGGFAEGGTAPGVVSRIRPSICPNVFGLNYLDGMSKSAADGDTAPLSPSPRRSRN